MFCVQRERDEFCRRCALQNCPAGPQARITNSHSVFGAVTSWHVQLSIHTRSGHGHKGPEVLPALFRRAHPNGAPQARPIAEDPEARLPYEAPSAEFGAAQLWTTLRCMSMQRPAGRACGLDLWARGRRTGRMGGSICRRTASQA
jgi:hypothetical protein